MKNKLITKYLLCLFCSIIQLLSYSALAQPTHEFSISGFGGLMGLNFKANHGDQKNGLGGGFGFGYQYGINSLLGIRTGLEIAMYNSEYNWDNLIFRYMTKDVDDNDFEFRSKAKNFSETQKATFLQIPIMLNIQINEYFFAAIGGKAGIPVSTKYKTSAVTVINSGFYATENYDYKTQQFLGFGTYNIPERERELSLKTAFFLSLEGGGKFDLSETLGLYVGIYFDYGLNNIVKDSEKSHLIDYDNQNPKDFIFNSIITSEYFTKKVSPIAAGIKIRLGF